MERTPTPMFTPDQIVKAMSMPEVMTPERMAFARQMSMQLARDPELLVSIERMLQENGVELQKMDFVSEQLETFGWTREEGSLKAMPTPQQAAAAAAAGVAALAAGAAAAIPV